MQKGFLKSIVIVLVIVLVLASTVPASAAVTYFTEDFESYTSTVFPSSFTQYSNTGLNYSSVINSGILYGNVFQVGGLNEGGANNIAYFSIEDDETELTLNVDISVDQPVAHAWIGLSDGEQYAYVYFNPGGDVETEAGVAGGYDSQQWYHLIIVMDLVNDTYDINLNGSTVIDIPTVTSPYGNGNPYVNVEFYAIPAQLSAVYSDNFNVTGLATRLEPNPQTGYNFWDRLKRGFWCK